MAKICAVVLNPVSRDARVLKEAETLMGAGHDVSVLGVADANFPLLHEVTPSGLNIHRVKFGHVKRASGFFYRIAYSALLLLLLLVVKSSNIFEDLSIEDVVTIAKQSVVFFINLAIIFYLSRLIFYSIRVNQIFKEEARQANSTHNLSKKASTGRSLIKTFETWAWFFFRLYPLYKVVKQLAPDVIHCHDLPALPLGLMVKLRLRCRLVYDAHEIYEEVPQASKGHRWRCRVVLKVCQRYVDMFITINNSIADWYADNYPKLPRAIVIMNATRISPERPAYDGRLHRAANLPVSARILLYQGGFSTHRGLEALVRSAAHLPDKWFLVMMGWGSAEISLKKIAKATKDRVNGKRDSVPVRFIEPAPQHELGSWTAGATVGVIPYENTGLNHWFCTPNKLWEYPNAAVPLLVSPFPEMRMQIEEYKHGWLLPEEIVPEGIANAVASLTEVEIEAAQRNTGRFIAENHWGIYEKRLTGKYRDLLQPTA